MVEAREKTDDELYILEVEAQNKELKEANKVLTEDNIRATTEAYRYKTAYEVLVKEIAK